MKWYEHNGSDMNISQQQQINVLLKAQQQANLICFLNLTII